ncbi:MAG: exo-alpha-sialidase, partial [Candidatus Jettenia caeni]|nr:exo-alpha-sialidase [Candidatus Jettenia caeni]
MLRREKVLSVISIISIVGFFGSMPVGAQPGHNTALARLERLSDRGKFLKQRLGKKVNYLSTGSKMIVNFGEQWGSIKPILERAVERGGFLKEGGMDTNVDKSLAPLAPFTGNNPFAKSDFFSRFAGSTQNETSVG